MNPITVYGIWHRFTQQVYIGHSVNTPARFAAHRNSLRRGVHHCVHLQRAWDRDGEAAFDFRPLAECSSKDEAVELEQTMLDAYFSSGSLYNSAASNDPREVMRHAHTPQAREENRKRRAASAAVQRAQQENIRKAHTPEAIALRVASTHRSGKWCAGKRVSVVSTCLYSGRVVRFQSTSDAARSLGISKGNISMCLAGKRSHANGYSFAKEAA